MTPAILEPASTNPASNSGPSSPAARTPFPRCAHRTAAGRRCRAEAFNSTATFCSRHLFDSAHRPSGPELAAELLGSITEFNSASLVTDFLSRLLILQAQDRISPRRAAVMTYTCNLLLRGLRAIDLEALATQTAEDAPGQQVVFELTRSSHDAVSDTTGAPIKPS